MKSSVPHRGLQDIRTMSERISDANNPQRKYLALAMLELEQPAAAGRNKVACQRVESIDQRLDRHRCRAGGASGRRRSGVGGSRTGRAAAPNRGRRAAVGKFQADLLIAATVENRKKGNSHGNGNDAQSRPGP